MAVQIFKDGKEIYIEPDSLQNHLNAGWSLEPSQINDALVGMADIAALDEIAAEGIAEAPDAISEQPDEEEPTIDGGNLPADAAPRKRGRPSTKK